ncbi:hypothetical protein BJ912DRAFT_1149536 [Pholiota molesta]|nr:hypothetical protein BJ912DRAFT_1149536 [Pholiota molesta]
MASSPRIIVASPAVTSYRCRVVGGHVVGSRLVSSSPRHPVRTSQVRANRLVTMTWHHPAPSTFPPITHAVGLVLASSSRRHIIVASSYHRRVVGRIGVVGVIASSQIRWRRLPAPSLSQTPPLHCLLSMHRLYARCHVIVTRRSAWMDLATVGLLSPPRSCTSPIVRYAPRTSQAPGVHSRAPLPSNEGCGPAFVQADCSYLTRIYMPMTMRRRRDKVMIHLGNQATTI